MKALNHTIKIFFFSYSILLLVSCGSSDNNTPPSTTIANNLPIADAGEDQTVNENENVTLDASGSSDLDGSISSYQWSQTAGTAVAISDSDVAMPNFTAPDVTISESLTFQVTVTDNDGAFHSDSVSIVVNSINSPPSANAGVEQIVDESSLVTLSAELSTDDDGHITQYEWTQILGEVVTLDSTLLAMPTFTAPQVEVITTLSFELTVTDNEGATNSAATNIIVHPIFDNEVPVSQLEGSTFINELYYEYTQRIGEKVWLMGFFGNTDINEDGAAFLVDNMLRLEVDEAFPHHTFTRLDGSLPPDSWQGNLILIYGEIKDYATQSGESTIFPTPLITVEKYELVREFEQNNSWDNIFLTPDVVPQNLESQSSTKRTEYEYSALSYAAESTILKPATGTQAQACDRSIIISGGVDKANNHKRYENNVVAKFNKMKELGFNDEQIAVFYNDAGEIDVNGTNIVDDKTSIEKLQTHFEQLAEDMPGSCTLTIFVTDHGTGYNQQQGYVGARPALSGSEVSNGTTHDENTFIFDARAKTFVSSDSFVFRGQHWFIRRDGNGTLFIFKWIEDKWVFKGKNDNGDNIISETELGGEDINNDGDTMDSDYGFSVAWLEARSLGDRKYYDNTWDTDRNGNSDVRLHWDGTRYVVEILVSGEWREMGRDTNGDYVIDIIDGGVDWNLDGDKADQVAFHEGINLWGNEVLWDDAFAELIRPLSEKGVHIMMEMVSCFSGGFVPNVKDLVENIYTGSSEDTKHYNRVGTDGKYIATDEISFLDNLVGIDTDSWNAAADAATAADDALAVEQNATKNIHVHEQTTRFETDSVFDVAGEGEHDLLLDLPDDLVGQIYHFEFIFGLQKPRWENVTFPNGLPDGLQVEDVPGGIRIFSDDPIPDDLVITFAVEGASLDDELRIEFNDANHNRLGYTVASEEPFSLPEQISFSDGYLNCVNHTDHQQSSPSILEWVLFANILDRSPFTDIALTVEVSEPSGTKSTFEIVLDEEGQGILLFQIFVFGDYDLEVIAARNVPTQEALELAGTLVFPFLVTAEETNKGQCNN